MSHNFYNSKRFEISDAGHACHLEKPNEFFKTLVKNLKIAR
jgi:pimeloyl-ACP methyl ester carboxylesterase